MARKNRNRFVKWLKRAGIGVAILALTGLWFWFAVTKLWIGP